MTDQLTGLRPALHRRYRLERELSRGGTVSGWLARRLGEVPRPAGFKETRS
jgi:hypothetical protein